MSETKFVGKGWAFEYGVNIKLKKADLMDIPENEYGDISLTVMRRREPDEKTKATHFVKVNDYVKGQVRTKQEEGQDLPF